MSVSLYDKALVKKIKDLIVDPSMVVLSPDESSQLFAWKADVTNDKPIQLPLIAITRDADIQINVKAKRPLTHSGKTFNVVGSRADHLNAIPITIKYNLDIYTRYRQEADDYLREFVFQFVNDPRITIDIPYNGCDLSYCSFIELEGSVSDNSDIPQRILSGQFTRYTIPLVIKDAQLFSYTTKTIPKVMLDDIEVVKDLSNTTPDFSNDIQFETVLK